MNLRARYLVDEWTVDEVKEMSLRGDVVVGEAKETAASRSVFYVSLPTLIDYITRIWGLGDSHRLHQPLAIDSCVNMIECFQFVSQGL